jgi:hypothetical protein
MYYPSMNDEVLDMTGSFEAWFESMHERLQGCRGKDENGFVSTVDLQLFRLNRSSPRCPTPTLNMQKRTIQAVIDLTRSYAQMERSGTFFYLWYAAHYLTELGASMLDSMIYGLLIASHSPTHLDFFDATDLIRTIRTFPLLLRKIASRWPDIQQQAAALEQIASPILANLQQRAKGEEVVLFDYSQIRQKLAKFLNCSETIHENLIVIGDDLSGMPEQFDYGWSPTSYFGPLPDHSNLDTTDAGGGKDFFWDLADLSSDQIFAGLLQGRTPIILPT